MCGVLRAGKAVCCGRGSSAMGRLAGGVAEQARAGEELEGPLKEYGLLLLNGE